MAEKPGLDFTGKKANMPCPAPRLSRRLVNHRPRIQTRSSPAPNPRGRERCQHSCRTQLRAPRKPRRLSLASRRPGVSSEPGSVSRGLHPRSSWLAIRAPHGLLEGQRTGQANHSATALTRARFRSSDQVHAICFFFGGRDSRGLRREKRRARIARERKAPDHRGVCPVS
jgi:hypothetical protein